MNSNENSSGGVIQIFCKAPLPGKAKTRLIPELGAEGAARLHAHLANSTFRKISEGREDATELWCAPDTSDPFFQQAGELHGFSLHEQHGTYLGERMAFALCQALEKYQWAILIGTDCPGLHAGIISNAKRILEAGEEVVFGPAADGGFYLVGLRRYPEHLFSGMQWGHERVMLDIESRLGKSDISWCRLETMNDLDRPQDLARFPELMKQTGIKNYALD
jgi:rSAM/selenodomain-associated transferase 1